jgi:phospholipid/cholesterol/gamma-HCH transport system substrate-binding protein
MESHAHFKIVGAFVIAFIVCIFGFVYWVQNTGGLGAQATYRVQFNQPASGLTDGSSVLFNGVRVGGVVGLHLNPKEPSRLTATIAVDPATPIRADTVVDVTYQGLTGAPAILLKGGSPDAPPLTGQNGQPPVLVAVEGAGVTLSDSARETLNRLDGILAENAKPLNKAIVGIGSFGDMLGRNSDRVEGILGGLEKLTGGGAAKKANVTFDLNAATDFPDLKKTIQGQMTVPDPSASLVFDTQKILIRSQEGTYSSIENAEWADNLPKLLQTKVVQSFENARQLKSVSRPIDQLEAEHRLELSIRSFQIAAAPKPSAVVEFAARLVNKDGEVQAARIFSISVPAEGTEAEPAVKALNDAFGKAAQELVTWTVGLI